MRARGGRVPAEHAAARAHPAHSFTPIPCSTLGRSSPTPRRHSVGAASRCSILVAPGRRRCRTQQGRGRGEGPRTACGAPPPTSPLSPNCGARQGGDAVRILPRGLRAGEHIPEAQRLISGARHDALPVRRHSQVQHPEAAGAAAAGSAGQPRPANSASGCTQGCSGPSLRQCGRK